MHTRKNRIKYRKYRESHETAHFYHDYINTRHYVCMWQPTFVKNVKSAYNYFHQLPFFVLYYSVEAQTIFTLQNVDIKSAKHTSCLKNSSFINSFFFSSPLLIIYNSFDSQHEKYIPLHFLSHFLLLLSFL